MKISVDNEQLLSVREASRYLGQQIDRLERGDVDKLVVMNRTRMAAVIITLNEYAKLTQYSRRTRPPANRRS